MLNGRRSLETDHIETVLRAYGAPWEKKEVQAADLETSTNSGLNMTSVRHVTSQLLCSGRNLRLPCTTSHDAPADLRQVHLLMSLPCISDAAAAIEGASGMPTGCIVVKIGTEVSSARCAVPH